MSQPINLVVVLTPLTTKPACIAEAVIAPVLLPLTRNPHRSLLPPLRLLKGGGNNPLLSTPLRPAPRPGTQGLNLTLPPSPSVLNPQQIIEYHVIPIHPVLAGNLSPSADPDHVCLVGWGIFTHYRITYLRKDCR